MAWIIDIKEENYQSNINLFINPINFRCIRNEYLKGCSEIIQNDDNFKYYRVSVEKNKYRFLPGYDEIEKNEKLFNFNPEERKRALERMDGRTISDKPKSYYNMKRTDFNDSLLTIALDENCENKIQKEYSFNEEISNQSINEESFN